MLWQIILFYGLFLFIKYLQRNCVFLDLVYAWRLLPVLIKVLKTRLITYPYPNASAINVFLHQVQKHPNKVALISTESNQEFTFKQLDLKSNQVANWLLEHNLVETNAICALMMPNCPEFIIIWLALWKVGMAVAFINIHLKSSALEHALKISNCSFLIASELYTDKLKFECPKLILFGIEHKKNDKHLALNHQIINQQSMDHIDYSYRKFIRFNDLALLIYTSGTTGLPKAAKVYHEKFGLLSNAARLMLVKEDDRFYCCMPLYHSAAACLSWGYTMQRGCSVVLAPKFSATKFFEHCSNYDVTVIQYIGEICRYLLNSPPCQYDTKHRIRLALGNGLRPEIWQQFRRRFNIHEIGEFYSATEANVGIANHQIGEQGIGSIGRCGPVVKLIMKMKLVRYDVEKDEHLRDKNGFMIECKPGQVGELVSKISHGHITRDFAGYFNNPQATSKKILRNVFKKGDEWFRTGDLMTFDHDHYFYFKDRIGDTFRWKGENVSTEEVAMVLNQFPNIVESNVYGIQVLSVSTGKACMASLKVQNNFDISKLYEHCCNHLPLYAIPLWIRIQQQIGVTATFKHIKYNLVQDGCDPDKQKNDLLYWLYEKQYRPFTRKEYEELKQGNYRL